MTGRPTRVDASGETDLCRRRQRAMHRRRMARLGSAVAVATLVLGLGAGSALAGEITGNGKLLPVNGKSECAFSGQEDLQWYFDDANTMPKPEATRGEPSRSQAWGRIPKADRDFLTSIGFNPGIACNPQKSGG
jgi:hypothetical protein